MTLRSFDFETGTWHTVDDEGWEIDPKKRHAKLLLQYFGCGLSERDRNFLFGLKTQRAPVSEKQMKWLHDIEGKLRRLLYDAVKRKNP
jgi:hypothetical protein